MKAVGIITFVIGIIAMFITYNFSGTSGAYDTYNIGALNDRTNAVLIACTIAGVGAIFIGFAEVYDILWDIYRKMPARPVVDNKTES